MLTAKLRACIAGLRKVLAPGDRGPDSDDRIADLASDRPDRLERDRVRKRHLENAHPTLDERPRERHGRCEVVDDDDRESPDRCA